MEMDGESTIDQEWVGAWMREKKHEEGPMLGLAEDLARKGVGEFGGIPFMQLFITLA
jgi:hypothetical protein